MPADAAVADAFGTLLVNVGKTYYSEEYPELWLFLMGATFSTVVLLFPNGLAGLFQGRRPAWLASLKTPRPVVVSKEPPRGSLAVEGG